MLNLLWLLLGLAGAALFLAIARVKPDREIQVLAIGLGVAAALYVGFAWVGGATGPWFATEMAGLGVYGLSALLGWRYSSKWLMLGWLAHPIWDLGLHFTGAGATYSPGWYVVTCVSFDLTVAAYLHFR